MLNRSLPLLAVFTIAACTNKAAVVGMKSRMLGLNVTMSSADQSSFSLSSSSYIPMHLALKIEQADKIIFADNIRNGQELELEIPLGEVKITSAYVVMPLGDGETKDKTCGRNDTNNNSHTPSRGNSNRGLMVAAAETSFNVTTATETLPISLGSFKSYPMMGMGLTVTTNGTTPISNAQVFYADPITGKKILEPCSNNQFIYEKTDASGRLPASAPFYGIGNTFAFIVSAAGLEKTFIAAHNKTNDAQNFYVLNMQTGLANIGPLNADYDGDGISNEDEIKNGTNPRWAPEQPEPRVYFMNGSTRIEFGSNDGHDGYTIMCKIVGVSTDWEDCSHGINKTLANGSYEILVKMTDGEGYSVGPMYSKTINVNNSGPNGGTAEQGPLSFQTGTFFDAGSIWVGSTREFFLVLSNTSTSTANITGHSFSNASIGSLSGGFPGGAGANCATTLPPNSSCTVKVTISAIGAGGLDTNFTVSSSVGSANVTFVGAGVQYNQEDKVVASGTNARNSTDYFGSAIAISGNTMAVATKNHSYDETGANSVSGAGAVFIYTRSGASWTIQQKVTGQGSNGRNMSDGFGSAVALHGETLVVAAYNQSYDQNGANSVTSAGAVFVFTRSGATWSLQQKIVGQGTNGRVTSDNFGFKLSLFQDTLAVGVKNQGYDENGSNLQAGAGAVFMYVRSGSTWSLQQKVVGTGTNGRVAADDFGSSVSIWENTLAVGATGQDTNETGASNVSNAGAVYVFNRNGSTWAFQQKLVTTGATSRTPDFNFGFDVALQGDFLAVSSPSDGLDANGANSVSTAGAVYIFNRNGMGGTWTFMQKVVGTGTNARAAADNFGHSIALDKGILVVGAKGQDYDSIGGASAAGAGAAYIFSMETGANPWTQRSKVVGFGTNGRNAGDEFGWAVGISGDTIVVGADSHGFDASGSGSLSTAGAVYTFR